MVRLNKQPTTPAPKSAKTVSVQSQPKTLVTSSRPAKSVAVKPAMAHKVAASKKATIEKVTPAKPPKLPAIATKALATQTPTSKAKAAAKLAATNKVTVPAKLAVVTKPKANSKVVSVPPAKTQAKATTVAKPSRHKTVVAAMPTPSKRATTPSLALKPNGRAKQTKPAAQAPQVETPYISQKKMKTNAAKRPTAALSEDEYAARPNPELSLAAAILKRRRSSKAERKAAALLLSQHLGPSPWSKLPPEERSAIARRGSQRRWEIWREERARLASKGGSQ